MAATLRLGDSQLTKLCRAAGVSQAELARQIGVSRQYVTKVKKGEKKFTLAQGIHASIVLGCHPKDLHDLVWVQSADE